MKLNELFGAMENKDLAIKTKKTYRNFFGQFSDFTSLKLGVMPYDLDHECLQEVHLIHFKKHLEDKQARPATIALAINALKFLIRIGKDDFDLDLGVHKIRIPKDKKPTFKGQTAEDREKIYRLLETEHPKDAMILALMILCGMRVQEVRTLKMAQVQETFLENVIGKGERLRDLPLPLRFNNVLIRFMDWRKDYPMGPEYPFIISLRGSVEGDPQSFEYNEKTIYDRVKIALTKANCATTNPHSLRHAYGYGIIEKLGALEANPTRALTIAQRLLGHDDIRTTLIYTQSPLKEVKKLIEEL